MLRLMRGLLPGLGRTAPRTTHTHIKPPIHQSTGQSAFSTTTAHDIQAQARAFVKRVVSEILPVPSPIRAPIPRNTASLHTTTTPPPLSYSVRSALNGTTRPRIFHPRGPIVPRSTVEVGLGTARKFSSSRPLFQNLIENVPIAARAFYEADFDLDRKEYNRRRAVELMKGRPKSTKKTTSRMRSLSSSSSTVDDKAFARYFAVAPQAKIVTYLTIPLAPNEARAPLPTATASTSALLTPEMGYTHSTYSQHGIRVTSLFRRLDTANVWDRGATAECYGVASIGDTSGVCSTIVVKFDGWTEKMVRDVIGEAGIDWCTLEEVTAEESEQLEKGRNLTATAPLPVNLPAVDESPISPALDRSLSDHATASLIMPTIDLSAQFMSRIDPEPATDLLLEVASTSDTDSFDRLSEYHDDEATPTQRSFTVTSSMPMSPISELSEISFEGTEGGSDGGSASYDSDSEDAWTMARTTTSSAQPLSPDHESFASASRMGWVGFSSEFATRAGVGEGLFL